MTYTHHTTIIRPNNPFIKKGGLRNFREKKMWGLNFDMNQKIVAYISLAMSLATFSMCQIFFKVKI